MTEEKKIAVVTGANRGLGFETSRQLARSGIRVILTSRSAAKGEAAMIRLREQALDVKFHTLDVTDEASVRDLAAFVLDRFGRLDILVNNAGIYIDPSGEDSSVFHTEMKVVRQTMDTNTFGALRVMQHLIPLMQGQGNVVNVASGMGQLAEMEGHYAAYRISKTALNALTRIFADELGETKIKVNSVCPGWVRTDLGGSDATRSVEEGADTIVWLATLHSDGPSGSFFRDRKPIPW